MREGSMKATELLHAPPELARADFLQLVRPGRTALVLVTVAAGGLLAPGTTDGVRLVHALIGTAVVAAGASCLNQLLERHTDACMPRTAGRPLPAGRVLPEEALALGGGLALGGLLYLLFALPEPTAAAAAGVALVSYLVLYTPLKRRTALGALLGSAAGALPSFIGWAAVSGHLDAGAVVPFLVVVLWQIPHVLVTNRVYRHAYVDNGLRVLPAAGPRGTDGPPDRTPQTSPTGRRIRTCGDRLGTALEPHDDLTPRASCLHLLPSCPDGPTSRRYLTLSSDASAGDDG